MYAPITTGFIEATEWEAMPTAMTASACRADVLPLVLMHATGALRLFELCSVRYQTPAGRLSRTKSDARIHTRHRSRAGSESFGQSAHGPGRVSVASSIVTG